MSCAVRGCTNCRRFPSEGISFHLFPRDTELLNKWLKALNKTNFVWAKNHRVCSKHFRTTDILSIGERRILKYGAVPSLLLNVEKIHAGNINQEEVVYVETLFTDEVIDLSDDESIKGYPSNAVPVKKVIPTTNNSKPLEETISNQKPLKDVITTTVKETRLIDLPKERTCAVNACTSSGSLVRAFPNPVTSTIKYVNWLNKCVNPKFQNMKPQDVFSFYGVCELHFDKNPIIAATGPTLNLPRKQPTKYVDKRVTLAPTSIINLPAKAQNVKIEVEETATKKILVEKTLTEKPPIEQAPPTSINIDKGEKMFKANELCRLCFINTGTIDLFTSTYLTKTLSNIIKEFLPIEVKVDDASKVICEHCVGELTKFYNFVVKTKEVNKYFQIIHAEMCAKDNKFQDLIFIEPVPQVNANETAVVKDSPILESILKKTDIVSNNDIATYSQDNNEDTIIIEINDVSDEESKLNFVPNKFVQSIHNYSMSLNKVNRIQEKKKNRREKRLLNRQLLRDKNLRIICIYCEETIDKIENFQAHCADKNHPPVHTCSECKKMFKDKDDLDSHMLGHTKTSMCDRCGKQFLKKESLSMHLKTVHNWGEMKFACDQCPKKFVSSTRLKTHMICHTNNRPYCCEQCGATFSTLPNLKSHQTTHSDYKPHVCLICSKGFRRKYRLTVHMTKHTNERKFSCEPCGISYKRRLNLNRHNRKHHVDKNVEVFEKPRNCTKCDFVAKSSAQLKMHMIKEHKVYSCTICNISFKKYQTYYTHRFKHNPQKMNFVCKYCDKRFINSTLLQVHMVVHTGEKRYECEVCNKRFSQKPHLQSHMFTHTGERPYKCKFCPTSYAHLSTLVVHQRIHTGETPYVCEFCNKGFGHLTNYKKHVLSQHGVVVPKKRFPATIKIVKEEEVDQVEEVEQMEQVEQEEYEDGQYKEEEVENNSETETNNEENNSEVSIFKYEDFVQVVEVDDTC